MNRDEARSRHEGDFQQLTDSQPHRLFPTDSLAGGTWFGANQKGLVLALLNRYQASNPNGHKSRGLLIPHFLSTWLSASQTAELDARALHDYNPFDLIASDSQQTWQLSWDGNDVRLKQRTESHFSFSSSALNTNQVLDYRQSLFKDWQQKLPRSIAPSELAQSVLRDFHLQQTPSAETQSVLMDRHEAHTKSICQARVTDTATHLQYFDESTLTRFRNQKLLNENPISHGLVFEVTS
jgi:uncharacterized protein with NRDE domain